MTNPGELGEPSTLSPDDAFSLLGNETRMDILQTLGEASDPLSFTELRERVGIRQGSQFNYHLDKLTDHYIQKTEDGYELRQAGRRVMYAVLSAAVTDAPILEPTEIDQPCPYCGAAIEIRYNEGHIEEFCTACDGAFEWSNPEQNGYIGCLQLPPAGLQDRSAAEAFETAWLWTRLALLAVSNGICPQCSARLEQGVEVCPDHDTTEGRCQDCGRRQPIGYHFECQNCIYDGRGTIELAFAGETALFDFLTNQGLNPVSGEPIATVQQVLETCETTVDSTKPLSGDCTFTANGDSLTLALDGDLDVTEPRSGKVKEQS